MSSAIPTAALAITSAVAGANHDRVGAVGESNMPDLGFLRERESVGGDRILN